MSGNSDQAYEDFADAARTKNRVIYRRKFIEYNNDPQRRCYNGCHFSTATYWTEWEEYDIVSEDKFEALLALWRDLNADAVKARGKGNTLCEYK